MRGAGVLKGPPPEMADIIQTEAEAAVALGLCNNRQELVDTWRTFCDRFEGEQRERLQATYARQLRLYGALHG